ncbi:MAG: ORF6N domain-containing protein [Bacilli bacterium]|nr:ORF6N domain-containing protein [Bacilli bacterium]
MLDFELARIYGYETRRFNRQFKNSMTKFPERYRFQLTKDEANSVMSKKSTSPKS